MSDRPSPDEDRELIKRLRRISRYGQYAINPDGPAAADRLESLLADRAKLEEALRGLLGSCSGAPVGGGDGQTRYVTGPSPDALRKARAALNRSTDRG